MFESARGEATSHPHTVHRATLGAVARLNLCAVSRRMPAKDGSVSNGASAATAPVSDQPGAAAPTGSDPPAAAPAPEESAAEQADREARQAEEARLADLEAVLADVKEAPREVTTSVEAFRELLRIGADAEACFAGVDDSHPSCSAVALLVRAVSRLQEIDDNESVDAVDAVPVAVAVAADDGSSFGAQQTVAAGETDAVPATPAHDSEALEDVAAPTVEAVAVEPDDRRSVLRHAARLCATSVASPVAVAWAVGRLVLANEAINQSDGAKPLCEFVLFLLRALRECRAYIVLHRITRQVAEPLLAALAAIPGAKATAGDGTDAARVLDDLLLGYQHGPEVFVRMVPSLTRVLDDLLADVDIGDGAIAGWRLAVASTCDALVTLHATHARSFPSVHERVESLREVRLLAAPSLADSGSQWTSDLGKSVSAERAGTLSVVRSPSSVAAEARAAQAHATQARLMGKAWASRKHTLDAPPIPWIEGLFETRRDGVMSLVVESSHIGYPIKGQAARKDAPGLKVRAHLRREAAPTTEPSGGPATDHPCWLMEGHFVAKHQTPPGDDPSPTVGLSASLEWACEHCTVVNLPTATSCTTCGKERAKSSKKKRRRNAPAPFRAVLAADATAFSGEWARGRVSGGLLGILESACNGFDSAAWEQEGVIAHPEPAVSLDGGRSGRPAPFLTAHSLPNVERDQRFFTVEAWVQPNEPITESQAIVSGGGFGLGLLRDGRVAGWRLGTTDGSPTDWPTWRAGLPVEAETFTVLVSEVPISTEEFTHIALTYSGVSLELYVGGVPVARSVSALPLTPVAGLPLTIGAEVSPDEVNPARSSASLGPCAPDAGCSFRSFLNARVAGVGVWSVAVPIAERASGDVPRRLSPGLVAYWPLIGSNTYCADHSGNGHHTVLRHAPPPTEGLTAVDTATTIRKAGLELARHPPLVASDVPLCGILDQSVGKFRLGGSAVHAFPSLHLGVGGVPGVAWFTNKVAVAGGFDVSLSAASAAVAPGAEEQVGPDLWDTITDPETQEGGRFSHTQPTVRIVLQGGSWWEIEPLHAASSWPVAEPPKVALSRKRKRDTAESEADAGSARPDGVQGADETKSAEVLAPGKSGADTTDKGPFARCLAIEVTFLPAGKLHIVVIVRDGAGKTRELGRCWNASAGSAPIRARYVASAGLLAVGVGTTPLLSVPCDVSAVLGLTRQHVWLALAVPGVVDPSSTAAAGVSVRHLRFAGVSEEECEGAALSMCAVCGRAPTTHPRSEDSSDDDDEDSDVAGRAGGVLDETQCPSCTYRNASDAAKCVMCQASLPSVTSASASAGGGGGGSDSGGTSRRGGWACPACTKVNSEGSSKCGTCGHKRAVSSTPNNNEHSATHNERKADADQPSTDLPPVVVLPPPPEDWNCAACTMRNSATRKTCEVCHTPRPKADPPAHAPEAKVPEPRAPQAPQEWTCSACTVVNPATRTVCSMCETKRPPPPLNEAPKPVEAPKPLSHPPGPWICSACTLSNDEKVKTCAVCHTPRPPPGPPPVPDAKESEEKNPGDGAAAPSTTDGAAEESKDEVSPEIKAKLSRREVLRRRGAALLQHAFKLRADEARLGDCGDYLSRNSGAVEGIWDTTMGLVAIEASAPQVVLAFVAQYGTAKKGGRLAGQARLRTDARWEAFGSYITSTLAVPNAFVFDMDNTAGTYQGALFRARTTTDFVGERMWEGQLVKRGGAIVGGPKLTSRLVGATAAGFGGLDNMKYGLTNVCYQNALLQGLNATHELRTGLLAAPLLPAQPEFALVPDDTADRQYLAWDYMLRRSNDVAVPEIVGQTTDATGRYIEDYPLGDRPDEETLLSSEDETAAASAATAVDSEEAQLAALLGAGDEEGWSPQRFGNRMQWLIARLVLSERSHHLTHALQGALPAKYRSGRQEDASEFRMFVLESLDVAFRSASVKSLRAPGKGDSMEDDDEGAGLAPLPRRMRRLVEDVFGGETSTVLRCAECSHVSAKSELMFQLDLNLARRFTPITDITAVIVPRVLGSMPVIKTPAGYQRLDTDLNKNRRGLAPYIFLCVQRGTTSAAPPITDVVLITAEHGKAVATPAGYDRLDVDLNQGGEGTPHHVYLCFARETGGSPVTDIRVFDADKEPQPDGFHTLSTDLNRNGGGAKLQLAFKQDMPLRDIKIRESGVHGYKFIDVPLHLTKEEYLCISDAIDGERAALAPITDMKVVTEEEVGFAVSQGYESVSMDPIADTRYLVVRRGHGCPVTAVEVFRAPRVMPRFEGYEFVDLAVPDDPPSLEGLWQSVDRSDPTRRTASFKVPLQGMSGIVVRGLWKGYCLKGIMYEVPRSTGIQRIMLGAWKFLNRDKEWKPISLTFTSLKSFQGSSNSGTKLTEEKFTGNKINDTSHNKHIKTRITGLAVVFDDEPPPEGFLKMTHTGNRRSSDLNAGVPRAARRVVLCWECDPRKPAIADIAIVLEPGVLEKVPEGYELIDRTPTGADANLNSGTDGTPMYLAVKYLPSTRIEGKGVGALDLLWSDFDDVLAKDFHRIEKTAGAVGQPANLNTGNGGHTIYLCYRKDDYVPQAMDHWINGLWDLPSIDKNRMALWALGHTTAMSVRGSFDFAGADRARGDILSVVVPAKDLKPPMPDGTEDESFRLVGLWSDSKTALYPGSPIYMKIDKDFSRMEGHTAVGAKRTPWKLVHDNRIRLAFKRDYSTVYRNGELVSTTRASEHSVPTMIDRAFCPTILGGDNKVKCSSCDKVTEYERRMLLTRAPGHLIVSLTRMAFRHELGKTVKYLDDVELAPVVELPHVPDEFSRAVYKTREAADAELRRARRYALYAVVVHSGMTANSGHYYAFARDSAAPDLENPESPHAPWVKYNDARVMRSSWREVCDSSAMSQSDTSYMCFFRRLPDVVERLVDGGAEATSRPVAGAIDVADGEAPLPPAAPRWLHAVLADNERFVLGQLQSASSSHLWDVLHDAARLRAGLARPSGEYMPVPSPETAVGGSGGASVSDVEVRPGSQLCNPAVSCPFCLDTPLADSEDPHGWLSSHTCRYSDYAAVECSLCGGVGAASAMVNGSSDSADGDRICALCFESTQEADEAAAGPSEPKTPRIARQASSYNCEICGESVQGFQSFSSHERECLMKRRSGSPAAAPETGSPVTPDYEAGGSSESKAGGGAGGPPHRDVDMEGEDRFGAGSASASAVGMDAAADHGAAASSETASAGVRIGGGGGGDTSGKRPEESYGAATPADTGASTDSDAVPPGIPTVATVEDAEMGDEGSPEEGGSPPVAAPHGEGAAPPSYDDVYGEPSGELTAGAPPPSYDAAVSPQRGNGAGDASSSGQSQH